MIIERITRIRYGIADALYRLGAVLLALYLRSKKRVLAAIPYATPEEWAGLAVLASVVFVVALGTIVVWHLFGTPGATAMGGICFGFWLCWQTVRPREPMDWRAIGYLALGGVLGAMLVAQAFLVGRTTP